MATRILVGDDDLDAHEILHDILHINFRQATVECALSSDGLLRKIGSRDAYDLILVNLRMQNERGEDLIGEIRRDFPEILDRIILMADSSDLVPPENMHDLPCIAKPFCLDEFGQVIREVCSA